MMTVGGFQQRGVGVNTERQGAVRAVSCLVPAITRGALGYGVGNLRQKKKEPALGRLSGNAHASVGKGMRE